MVAPLVFIVVITSTRPLGGKDTVEDAEDGLFFDVCFRISCVKDKVVGINHHLALDNPTAVGYTMFSMRQSNSCWLHYV